MIFLYKEREKERNRISRRSYWMEGGGGDLWKFSNPAKREEMILKAEADEWNGNVLSHVPKTFSKPFGQTISHQNGL